MVNEIAASSVETRQALKQKPVINPGRHPIVVLSPLLASAG